MPISWFHSGATEWWFFTDKPSHTLAAESTLFIPVCCCMTIMFPVESWLIGNTWCATGEKYLTSKRSVRKDNDEKHIREVTPWNIIRSASVSILSSNLENITLVGPSPSCLKHPLALHIKIVYTMDKNDITNYMFPLGRNVYITFAHWKNWNSNCLLSKWLIK